MSLVLKVLIFFLLNVDFVARCLGTIAQYIDTDDKADIVSAKAHRFLDFSDQDLRNLFKAFFP